MLLKAIDVVEANPDQQPGSWDAALTCFGLSASIAEKATSIDRSGIFQGILLALTDDALDEIRPMAHVATGRRFLVNVTPLLGDEVKPFEQLEVESKGIKRLGVLRMDVDNLGKLFSDGFRGQATLSRVAALSFAISLYFEGWVEHLAEQMNQEDGQGRLYSIYSGGDDLFFVGSWDAVVELARRVRKDLTPYAASHPGIHTSAGIVLVGGKYPLAQAAQDAGEAESQAKAYRLYRKDKPVVAKDAICFLGEVQPWKRFGVSDESDTVHALAKQLVTMVEGDGASRGAPTALIQNLARLYDQYTEVEQQRRAAGRDLNQVGDWQPLWGPWMWRGFYMLKRMARSTEFAEIEKLAERLHAEKFYDMARIGLAARWAELLTRD